jgi:hypothetical protein
MMRVCVPVVLAWCALVAPALAQRLPPEDRPAGRAPSRSVLEPSEATLERIQLELRADRPAGLVDPFLLDRQAVELANGLDLVSQPLLSRPMPAAVPYGPPTHQEMLNVMTPRWFTEGRPSADLLGVTTGAAVSLLPVAVKALTGLFDGPEPPEQFVLNEDGESAAMAFARADPRVLEAHIRQQGRTIDLSLVVQGGTAADIARQLGEQFVVLVKSLVPGELNPGATIGPGVYDYLVRVSSPRGAVIVSGGKSSADARLTWEG